MLLSFSFSFLFLHFFFFFFFSNLPSNFHFEGDETEDYLNAIKEKIKAQERI